MGCEVGSGACLWQLSPTFLPSAPSANPPHPKASPGWVRRASNPKETPRGDDQFSVELLNRLSPLSASIFMTKMSVKIDVSFTSW